ncbi:membrane protein [Dictyobacter alpinus]|uniref:Membrane protein n=1 Tax=Dictyobacter alpinus TaxID=2014873 RepID=A0A402BA25_9CHLR|nr:phosphotransferase [Dictyobacter alpinus]GCE28228.1 membrane protein [Dictyobacter alpinus]
MKTIDVERVCTMGGLGKPRGELQAVAGGLLHHVCRLETSQGVFAIKQLNPAMMGEPDTLDAYRMSEKIAHLMAERGIPAVAALPLADGDVIYNLDGMALLVYPWIEGPLLSASSLDLHAANTLGGLLAQLHALQLTIPELPPFVWKHLHDEDWDILTFQASDLNLAWANPVRSLLPQLLEWTRAYEEAGTVLGQHMLVSHTNCEPGNVIWSSESSPWLIDWEAAGWINPTMELVRTALTWSGITTGQPREEIFSAILAGYTAAGGVIQDTGRDALHGCMGTWLGWLLFTMRRSLGESVTSEEEEQIGIRETSKMVATLRLLTAHEAHWVELVERWR